MERQLFARQLATTHPPPPTNHPPTTRAHMTSQTARQPTRAPALAVLRRVPSVASLVELSDQLIN